MGTKAREITGVDLQELLKMLKKAYADEWLAYYQYWIGSKVAKGRMRGIIAEELEEHAKEELNHADMLTKRIITLGGTPPVSPAEIQEMSSCGYDSPSDPNTKKLLEQNIKGEQCAIMTYKKIIDFTAGKDPVTYDLVLEILKEEIEHEEDLQAMLEDMGTPVK